MSGRCMVCARSRTRYQTQQATAAATLFFDDLLARQTANHVSGDLSNSRRSALHWANELARCGTSVMGPLRELRNGRYTEKVMTMRMATVNTMTPKPVSPICAADPNLRMIKRVLT